MHNDKYILHFVKYKYIIKVTEGEVDRMNFFKKNKMEDEWLVQTRNKIFAEIYVIIVLIAAVSLIVKYFFLQTGFISIVTEFIILLVISIYYGIRSVYLGVYAAEMEMKERKGKIFSRKRSIMIAIFIGVGIAIVFGLNSAIQYADGFPQNITYFFITFLASIMIYMPLSFLFIVIGDEMVRRKSKKIAEEMLVDESTGDENEKY